MTSKDLSRELCEICGIKPKTIEDYNLNEYKIYPDFENPENFVKLLEIIHDRMSIVGLLMYEIDEDSLTRRFLKLVIKFLSDELGYVETKIDTVKQAIRETEWVYD